MAKDKECRREKKETKEDPIIGSYKHQNEVSWIQHIVSIIAYKIDVLIFSCWYSSRSHNFSIIGSVFAHMRELNNDRGVMSFGSSLNCMLLEYMIMDLDGQVRVL